jgi:membrane-associated phospholipid phosphatase
MSLRAMLLKYNTTMSPARHFTKEQQEEIRRKEERLRNPPPVQQDVERENPLPESIYAALDSLFEYTATQNLGPTRTARLNYLWFTTILQAYEWTQPTHRLKGTKDRWDWNAGIPLATNKDQSIWMHHMLAEVMPLFVPTFNVSAFLQKERDAMGWTVGQQEGEWARVRNAGNWSDWWTAWQTWWTARQSDGSTEALISPADSVLPNGTTVLDVAATEDPATFPQPLKWSPLKVGIKTQKYLTYNWMSVRSSVFSGEDGTIIQAAAKKEFLKDAAKEAEIAELLAISQSLTDAQKVQAEFWAGGPNTLSPPGIAMWFWRDYMETYNIPTNKSWDDFLYSGYNLAVGLFEASRLVWGLKKVYMEARPIQYIRRLYRGQTLRRYDGVEIQGESWVPYQELDFVTPPFADFPSGHSAFSQVLACVMTEWFGSTFPASPAKSRSLHRVCPSLADQSAAFGTFTFPTGASRIQPSVPSTPQTFSWSSWQEVADAAGLSRKYGGIHATSAHVGSQALANALHVRLKMRLGF